MISLLFDLLLIDMITIDVVPLWIITGELL